MRPDRSLAYGSRRGDRYWWHRLPESAFVPPIYAMLSDEEWGLLDAWFDDTDARGLIGEMNVPAMCVLQGFVMGSMVRNIIHLGACAGYSTLLTGFMMRRMRLERSVLAIDIDPAACAFCETWIARAGLSDYVRIERGDSADPGAPARARAYFGGPVNLVFVDSSHRYAHTLAELDLWAAALNPGGFLFLHDTSEFATRFDPSGEGGVRRAFAEWMARNPGMRAIDVSNSLATLETPAQVYKDGCGLGIVQKPS
jgi:cephalosporin hydroxylase